MDAVQNGPIVPNDPRWQAMQRGTSSVEQGGGRAIHAYDHLAKPRSLAQLGADVGEGGLGQVAASTGENERNRALAAGGHRLGFDGGEVGVVQPLEGTDRSCLREVAHGRAGAAFMVGTALISCRPGVAANSSPPLQVESALDIRNLPDY
jgi:hypothetical protein